MAHRPDADYPRWPHYVSRNHRSITPHRWIVMDTEAHRVRRGKVETLSWRLGVATRWRDDLKEDRAPEWLTANDPRELWEWVTQFLAKRGKTVLWCHNLGFDLRISRAFEILPQLGYELRWVNLDRDVSVCTWTHERGTLTMTDTHTWLPTSLARIAADMDMSKTALPDETDTASQWERRCVTDVLITATAVREILTWCKEGDLGNFQPTGAGQAWAAWRHRMLGHKILCHSDTAALEAERHAMHAGRAEAWIHGRITDTPVTVWDLTAAYPSIAATTDLPRILYDRVDEPTLVQYRTARRYWTCLVDVTVTVTDPVLPVRHDDRVVWPVGTFRTIVWDIEADLADEHGVIVTVHRMWRYRAAPILRDWAQWTLSLMHPDTGHPSAIVRRWAKHTSRAMVGRMALRYPQWTDFGGNPGGHTGTSLYRDMDTAEDGVLLHVGAKTMVRTGRVEGGNSLPQVTSYIMAACRVRLWNAIQAAGEENVSYMDTDSVYVGPDGDARMAAYASDHPELGWRRKAVHRKVELLGPRLIRMDGRHSMAGVPRTASRAGPVRYSGEVWESVGASLAAGHASTVTVADRSWDIRPVDHRRTGPVDGPTEPHRMEIDASGSNQYVTRG